MKSGPTTRVQAGRDSVEPRPARVLLLVWATADFVFDTLVRLVVMSAIAVLSFIIALQVVWRYGLNHALAWPEELARFLFVWVSLLGMALAVGERANIAVLYVVDLLPRSVSRVVDALAHVTLIAFFVAAIPASFRIIEVGMQSSTTALGISNGWAYVAFPVGFGVAIYQHIAALLRERMDAR